MTTYDKQIRFDDEEETRGQQAQPQRVFPAVANDIEREHGGDEHVGAHGNAVGRRQIARRLEHHHCQHDGHEQAPVHEGQVDLAHVLDAGVQHLQPWQVAQLDDLLGDRECPRDQGLRGNHRGHGGQAHQGQQGPVRSHVEEGVFHGAWVVQQQSALAEVIERERRHDDGKPGQADGLFTEVAHVGVQRLAPGHAQHHGAQNDEGSTGVVP